MLFEASVLVCAVPPFHDLILLTFVVFLSSNRSCWAWASGTDFFGGGPLHFLFWWRAAWCDPMVWVFMFGVSHWTPSPLSASHFRWEAHSPVYFHFEYTFEWRLWGQNNNCAIGWLCNKMFKITLTWLYLILLKELCSLKRREILNKLFLEARLCRKIPNLWPCCLSYIKLVVPT